MIKLSKVVLFASFLLVSASGRASESIEIKGIAIGMTEEQAARKLGLGPPAYDPKIFPDGFLGLVCRPVLNTEFTVGGARIISDVPGMRSHVCFRKKLLVSLSMHFPSDTYEDIRKAVQGKYQGTKCTKFTSPGGDYLSMECEYSTRLGVLRLWTQKGAKAAWLYIQSRPEHESDRELFERVKKGKREDI